MHISFNKQGLILAVALLIASATGFAQTKGLSRKEVDKRALTDFESGAQAAGKRDSKIAIRYYESAIKREPNFVDALVELAGAHYELEQFEQAETYLERVVKFDGVDGTKALYGLAMSELKQQKYGEAIQHLDAYLALPDLREDRKKAAERFRREAAFKEVAYANPVDFKLERLPKEINTPAFAEYLPALTADENTLVFTRRVDNRQEDFFISRKVDGIWQEAQPIVEVNTLENEGAQTMSADGKLLVFTACNRPDGLGSCDLYFSQFLDGAWTPPANLGAPINTKAWETQPSLSANGNLLFFASTREGGQGKADIYASGRTADGGWTEPINLGPVINTPEDDQSPFFHADGRTLYFMSAGHPGMGSFDLYVTRLGDDNKWTVPQNLGYPINTENMEGAIAVSLDGKTAYYATDVNTITADSIGVGGARGGTTDLFTFTLPPDVRAGVVTYLKARVIDAVTEVPVAAAALISDAATDKPFVLRRASAEEGTFLAVLPSGKTYTLAVEEPGYLFYSDRFELLEPADVDEPFELLIRLQPVTKQEEGSPALAKTNEPIVLRNVLFETNSAALMPASEAELKRLVTLLETNPELRIRIQGHTDDVGAEMDNLNLSERRALAVKDYLINAGIAASRLESKGFGESLPLLPNDTDLARALNRRTEFLVL